MIIKELLTYLFYFNRLQIVEEGGGTPDVAAPAPAPADDAPLSSTPDEQHVHAAKPEGLEDSFWDEEKKEIRMDALLKSYADTRKMVHEKEEGIRMRLKTEMAKERPEAPEKYEINDLGIEAPAGYQFNFTNEDPMLEMWRNIAFQSNLSNEQFMEGVRTWVSYGLSNRPDPVKELEKLGENGPDRKTRLDQLLNKHLEPEDFNQIADLVATAEGIQVLEKLIEGIGGSRLPDIDGMVDNKTLTLSELQQMQRDPRYTGRGAPRDNAFIAQVANGFRKLKQQRT